MRNVIVKGLGAGLAALTVFAYTASGQLITYVDATHGAGGNTTLTDGSVWEPTTDAQNNNGWNMRTNADPNFGNDNSVYESVGNEFDDAFDPANADAHPLRTTVSGLAENTYDVFVYFWSSDDGGFPGGWPIRATLDGEADQPWPLFNPGTEGDVTVADAGNFTDPGLLVSSGNRTLFQAHLGEFTGTEYSVFIDDLPATSNGNRTWFDGVGHSVVPEPSTYALFLGLAVFAVLGLRKRRR